MVLLTQFLLRLSFGLAAAMALVSPRQVTSGYFRNHLYVTLGLCALAALLSRAIEGQSPWPAALAAVASYAGSACWLYEQATAGRVMLAVVAATALWGAWEAAGGAALGPLAAAQTIASGAALGAVMAAMLLGHWYLNAPGMSLEPLRRLLGVAAAAVVAVAAVAGAGLSQALTAGSPASSWWLMLALRWSFGLAGVLVLLWMARRTLDVPNTQSATGILYVAVIGMFVGETMSLLLSAESVHPL